MPHYSCLSFSFPLLHIFLPFLNHPPFLFSTFNHSAQLPILDFSPSSIVLFLDSVTHFFPLSYIYFGTFVQQQSSKSYFEYCILPLHVHFIITSFVCDLTFLYSAWRLTQGASVYNMFWGSCTDLNLSVLFGKGKKIDVKEKTAQH